MEEDQLPKHCNFIEIQMMDKVQKNNFKEDYS
jgi:hypothetical protein